MYEQVIKGLQEDDLVIDEGLLKPGGQQMVERKLAAIRQQTGRSGHVWARPLGEGVEGLAEVFSGAGLDAHNDLLVVFDGRTWAARGWGLDRAAIRSALADAERGLQRNWAHGVVAALTALDLAAHDAGADRPPALPGIFGGLALGAVLIGGALGWTYVRQRAAAQRGAGSGGDGEEG